MTTLTGPYASAVHVYLDAGWSDVLPLPILAKSPPPDGYTGHWGATPSEAQIYAWVDGEGDGNLALRVPDGVIGIDVDHYGAKRGYDVLAELEAQWGRLPATWISTSRPHPSGIRLFRSPAGVQLTTAIAGGIEIVQHHHRYLVAWPSVHPDTGMQYQWIDPSGELADGPPEPSGLPALPEAWVEGLGRQWQTTGEAVDNGPVAEHRETAWSQRVLEALDAVDLGVAGGRHDGATAGAMALARLEQLGHPGATSALDVLGQRFVEAVTAPGAGQRSLRDAQREWGAPGGILPSARERARTTPAAGEPWIDRSEVEVYVAMEHARAVALGMAFDGPPPMTTAGPQPVDWPTFWTRERRADDWAIPQVVPAGRLVTVWAARKTGKSLFVLDVAAAAASGRPILGGEAIDPIPVMYLDMEMTEDDLDERLSDLGYGPDVDLSRFHYYLLPTLPPLDSTEGGLALMELVRRHEPQVVVIDTMARVVSGEENSADTYRAFYRATGMLLKQAGVACVRLDHAGKDKTKGERGSSAKGDDVDLSWELSDKGDGSFQLHRSYTRVSWVAEDIYLRRETDPLRHVEVRGFNAEPKVLTAAHHMDHLELPLDVTVNAAQKALQDSSFGAPSKATVTKAVRFRKMRKPDVEETAAAIETMRSGLEPPSEPPKRKRSEPWLGTA